MTLLNLSFSINGSPVTIETTAVTAVDVIREDLDLTGTKMACGGGQCGSCVVALDGVPVASCLLPVEDLAGTEVTTVEGLGRDGLHPIQRAFIALDALQCGFCTPGFVVEAAAFCDVWRSERGDVEPPDDDVEKALSGHLCRCGAYRSILAAVKVACRGDFDAPTVPLGRPDALDKVTGVARYTVDVRLDGMAYGSIIRSRHGHADIVEVDINEAMESDGFLAFVSLLDGSRVRYVGQPIAAVAATTHEQARMAARLVRVGYNSLSAVTTIDDALAEDAPDLHEGGWRPPSSNESAAPPAMRRGNLRGPTPIGSTRPLAVRSRLRRARETEDPLLVEHTWMTQSQAHTPMEPHACLADWASGSPLVYLSTQAVGHAADQIAARYDLDRQKVTVIAEHVGGAFGSKQGLTNEVVAALELSRRAGVPVSVVFDRAEEIAVGGNRPGAVMDVSVLGTADRKMAAMSMRSKGNGGASAGQLVATWGRLVHPGVARLLVDYDVVTNRPPAKPFRAPGGPTFAWAFEQAVDELAGRLGVDQITMRRGWSPSPPEQLLLSWVEGLDRWRNRKPPDDGRMRRGVGVAFSTWFYGFDPKVAVRIRLESGRVVVETAAQDMGNGTRAVLRDSVSAETGIPEELIDVATGRSDLPRGTTSSGSRTTASLVPAAAKAARRFADEVMKAAREGGFPDASVGHSGLVHAGELVPWDEILGDLPPLMAEATRPSDFGWPILPFAVSGLQLGRGLTRGAHVVEIDVDTMTGMVRPVWAGAALIVGRIVSPRQATSQVEGGIVQGISYALHEEWNVDRPTGRVISSDFDSYRIAGLADTPPISVEFIEAGFEHAASGGAGLSELATVGVAAAIGNAAAAATGRRFRMLPIRPGPGSPL